MSLSTRIQFCFPEEVGVTMDKYVRMVQDLISEDGYSGYAGFEKKEDLMAHLVEKMNIGESATVPSLQEEIRNSVTTLIQETITRAYAVLGSSAQPITCYIFPWVQREEDVMFGGVNGYAPFDGVIHLYVDAAKLSMQSLGETVAHELNHATFFHFNHEEQTLLDAMIFEGLAECFREEVVGGAISAWAKAVSYEEGKSILSNLKQELYSTDFSVYQEVFLSEGKYKRWTGYSIGYHVVASFRKSHASMSWADIIMLKPSEIFEQSSYLQ